ncbi:MAG: L-seryl-tRNA(Sec) selenium transferase [Desulfobacterales bacterium]|nr:L-seryl-tRNA(Sec) selenium transferase [Desulfobacterales bacterium]
MASLAETCYEAKENRNIENSLPWGKDVDSKQQSLLRKLPGVDRVLELWDRAQPVKDVPRTVLVRSIRTTLDRLRIKVLADNELLDETMFAENRLLRLAVQSVNKSLEFKLRHVINATGVVVHTNLGRSLLSEGVARHVAEILCRYSNLEFDLEKGERGSRYSCVEEILCEISGVEAAMVVNNNAGAVFLSLETLAKAKEVIVSRGELVEIGGSFRIPDVMASSGAKLVEVGTTNRTHLSDYEGAIRDETALLLKVHTSNYSMVGFTAEVPLNDLVTLGAKYHLPVMKDLGSGNFVDFSKYGLMKEPTVQETVATGADVVTFSGDKMLGGPQAGIIVGRKDALERIKKNPINRALRIDKMTLAALEATLHLYRDESKAVSAIPTLRMLTLPLKVISNRANRLRSRLRKLGNDLLEAVVINASSRVGGGALPLQELPTKCVGVRVKGLSASRIERIVREADPPIIGRIENDLFVMDMRTVQDDEIAVIASIFKKEV